jgi:pimeloyl-ACP methyl ester carboxylesterase
MRPNELRALGEIAGDGAVGIVQQAREVHAGVAGRVFGALKVLGPAAAPVRLAHDGISAGAYAVARTMSRGIVSAGATALSVTRPRHAPAIDQTPAGRLALAALNGVGGDRLHQRNSVLETPMALRRGGRDLSMEPGALAAAFPDAGPRLAVFVHGLCETDEAWQLRSARSTPYGERLHAELGYTPIYVRYNSGLHISANGRRLAELLDELAVAWPVPVTEIALIGHSMGGLVCRSACHYAGGARGSGSWRELVRHVFLLGSPHKGAPLELGANALCHVASLLPEVKPFATLIRVRSAGIKDLGYGYVVDEDWDGHDPDAFWSNTATVVPFLDSATHYFVSATLSREPDAPLGRYLGDLLVLGPSAWSQRSRNEHLQFPVTQYRHLGGATHFDLLNHPAVYDQIRSWIGPPRELPMPRQRQLPAPA